jgi:hypothetical protein
MGPFHLSYGLTRRQRLAVELMPWLPAIAATVGFGLGAVFMALAVSPVFLVLVLLPLSVYPGLVRFVIEIVFRARRPVEVTAADGTLEVRTGGERRELPLDGIIQVFREGDVWTVLHLDGTALSIPLDAITPGQVEFLRAFAHRRAAAARASHAPG